MSDEHALDRMLKAVEAYVEYYGAVHDEDCPADDTCDCSSRWINAGVSAAMHYLEKHAALKSKPEREHPYMTDRFSQGTCEAIRGEGPHPLERICDQPAALRYPAMGGGYARLCAKHGEPHRAHCGEWNGVEWSCGPWERPPAVDAVDPVGESVTK